MKPYKIMIRYEDKLFPLSKVGSEIAFNLKDILKKGQVDILYYKNKDEIYDTSENVNRADVEAMYKLMDCYKYPNNRTNANVLWHRVCDEEVWDVSTDTLTDMGYDIEASCTMHDEEETIFLCRTNVLLQASDLDANSIGHLARIEGCNWVLIITDRSPYYAETIPN